MALRDLGERQQELLRTLLVNRDGCTKDELAERLHIARTAVTQHLISLEDDQYVARGILRFARGRPSQVYLLTVKGIDLFPKQYSWFSSLLLAKIRADRGQSALEQDLEQMALDVAGTLASKINGQTASERVSQISEVMKEIGYESRVPPEEEKNSLPVIEAYNCVYHNLALENPELCRFDLKLLTELSNSPVRHEECIAKGGKCCRFRFEESRKIT